MHSMTGFGRASHTTDTLIAHIEAHTVNRKQSDIIINLPRPYTELETELRKHCAPHIARGRLTVNILLERPSDQPAPLHLNRALAKAFAAQVRDLSTELQEPLALTMSDLLALPNILLEPQADDELEQARAAILPALDTTLERLTHMRQREGQDLKQDITQRLGTLQQHTRAIETLAPQVITDHKAHLLSRLNDAGLDLDPSDERVLKEISIFAERCDISEEITRLDSHHHKFHEYLEQTRAVGRPLDFLCQELNRELNTIGSKAHNATIAQHIVSAKAELEKIREQVQNIE